MCYYLLMAFYLYAFGAIYMHEMLTMWVRWYVNAQNSNVNPTLLFCANIVICKHIVFSTFSNKYIVDLAYFHIFKSLIPPE